MDSVELQARRVPRFSGPAPKVGRPPARAFEPQLHLIVGDQSGARTEITVPYDRRCLSAPSFARSCLPRGAAQASSPSPFPGLVLYLLCGSSNAISI